MAVALTMLMLMTTTPYPQLFAILHRFLPRAVGDGLLLTYRFLFVLLDLIGDIWTALRLRGGLTSGRHVRNVAHISAGFGLLFLRAIALSERLYAAMRVRGYAGRLMAKRRSTFSGDDLYPLCLGLSLAGLSVASSLWPAIVVDYLGYALLLALGLLLASIVYTRLLPPQMTSGG